MIQTNPEIDLLVKQATELASTLNHSYVTVEHMTLALVEHKPFNDLLNDFGADTVGLITDLKSYLLGQAYLESKNSEPPKKNTRIRKSF